MRMLIVCVLAGAFVMGPADLWAELQQPVASDVEMTALKEMAARIPPGTRVKAHTTAGRGITGTLMSATDAAVIIKKRTRLPEPAITIPFAELARLEIDKRDGMSAGKIIGIGLSAGAGAILTLLAIFATLDD